MTARRAAAEETTIIPKIFHFIWIGPKPLPDHHREWIGTWEYHHPDWEIRIWGNDDLPPLRNQAQFERARSWAGKADVLRVEVIHQVGGVYLDTDMECLRPIDELLVDCDAFLARADTRGVITNCIFGAAPGHELTGRFLELIPRHFHPRKPYLIGPAMFTRFGEDIPSVRIFEKRVFSPVSHPEKSSLLLRPDLPGSYSFHWYEESWIKHTRWSRLTDRALGWFLKRSPWRERL